MWYRISFRNSIFANIYEFLFKNKNLFVNAITILINIKFFELNINKNWNNIKLNFILIYNMDLFLTEQKNNDIFKDDRIIVFCEKNGKHYNTYIYGWD